LLRVPVIALERMLEEVRRDGKPRYQEVFNALSETTRQQIETLEASSAIEWRE